MKHKPIFPLSEYQERLQKVRESMEKHNIDLLLIADPSNMYWLTGYDGWSFYVHQFVLISLDKEPIWFGRGIDRNGAKLTTYLKDEDMIAYSDDFIQNPPKHPVQELCHKVIIPNQWKNKKIGIEMDNYYFTAQAYQELVQNLPKAEFKDATGLVNWKRAIKSSLELELMKVAAKIVDKMHNHIYDLIKPGLKKNVLAGEIYKAGCNGTLENGGDYTAFAPILASGIDASASHLTWNDSKLKTNEGTFFEIAGCFKRYHCPLSRTIFLGKPPQKFLDAEKALIEGLENGLAQFKVGNQCQNVYHALTNTLKKYGFDRQGNRCGYSIGASYPPDWGERTMSLRDKDETILQAGMCFHFMPGLWLDDWGIEITESIYLTENGVKPFCKTARKLLIK